MWTKANIWRILRLAIVLLPLMFVLTSCAKDAANQTDKSDETLAAEHSECWQDKILTSIYEAMGGLSMDLYKDITKGALALEMTAFALWFCIRLIKFVSSITPENSGEVWNEVFKKLFLCLFCGILASSTTGCLWVLNTIVFPIYNAFLQFGGEILNSVGEGREWKEVKVLGWPANVKSTPKCIPTGSTIVTETGFPESPMVMMNCMVCAMSDRLSIGTYISFRIMRATEFMQILNGIILLVCFWVIKLGFVFYLVDNIFKFAVMVVMMPVLILFYPFQKKWAVFGVKTIISSAAFMMCISIMLAVCMSALLEIIVANPQLFNPDKPAKELKETGGVFLAIMLLALLVWSTIKVAKEITESIADAKIDNSFQQKLLGLGVLLLGLLTAGAGAALAKVKMVQQARAAYQKTAWARNIMKIRKYNKKLNEWAGRDEE